jgi:L-fuconate dehydratase
MRGRGSCASSSSTCPAIDYIAISGSLEGRVIEYVDHLHEHFIDPGRDPRRPLCAPLSTGYSARCFRLALRFRFPDGDEWQAIRAEVAASGR